MATFLVAHGAWAGGWAWKKMHPRLRALGHDLLVPTHTGIGARAHLASPDVGLSTHVADLLGTIECEGLDGFILVGHSYGGLVATAVADRVPERIARLVYVDAFVPQDGEALFDLIPVAARDAMLAGAREHGDGWRVPPNPLPEDTPQADRDWAEPRRVAQPVGCFREPVALTGAVERLPRSYIYCTRPAHGDGFARFARRAREESGWTCADIDSSHSAQITAPDALAALLASLAG